MQISKPWGYERIIEQTDVHVIKEIYVKPGHMLSKQYHEKKIEHMTLVNGKAILYLNDINYVMKKYVPYYIPALMIHRLSCPKDNEIDGGALIIEISSIELDDVVRLEDAYGRY